jgi:membrane-associated phospholipid phosphatase
MFFIPEAFMEPLEGEIFTFIGEWMRTNLHYPGGCLPSPHCASATVMIVMMYRYNRVLFWSLLPIVLTLYVSTVYGRYHYSWDGVAGILLSLLVLKSRNRFVWVTGKFMHWIRKEAELHSRKIEPRLTWKEDVP